MLAVLRSHSSTTYHARFSVVRSLIWRSDPAPQGGAESPPNATRHMLLGAQSPPEALSTVTENAAAAKRGPHRCRLPARQTPPPRDA